ncbi:MAG: hypothetical protein Q9163_003412 [Psora crenata]
MEAVAIIGCAAAVVTAFQQGDILVKKLQRIRRKQGPVPPKKLEESLALGPPVVRQANQYGKARFGSAFENGDRISNDALMDIVIHLQGRLLNHLAAAEENGSSVHNFNDLVYVSDSGRKGSVRVLKELYMRMEQGASVVSWQGGVGVQRSEVDTQGLPQMLAPGFGVEKPPTLRSEWGTPTPKLGLVMALANDVGCDSQQPMSTTAAVTHTTKDAYTASTTTRIAHNTALKQLKNTIMSLSIFSPDKPKPHGLCQGACTMRTVNKGMVLRNQLRSRKTPTPKPSRSTSMTGQSHYWAGSNSKCSFEGGAVNVGKQWTFDESVRIADGVRYQWRFLAKSHIVPTGRVKNQNYHYQCVLCSAQGMPPVITRGETAFIQHGAAHGGGKRNPFGMQLIIAEFGRVALEEEGFDVNLLQLAYEESDSFDERRNKDEERTTKDGKSCSQEASDHQSMGDLAPTTDGDPEIEHYSPAILEEHPALRDSISIPNPWRTSYLTM